ncbi:MAG TPA: hypothetical protein VMZ52_20030 [Bryobacteraceae bacterium]|nr:hypothetical protein [Bryobacteraceae bacterium]
MRLSYLLCGSLLLSAGNMVWGACQDGTKSGCRINGKAGTRECINGKFGPCEANEPPPPPPVTGTVSPKYYVLTVIYAPPGTAGGGSQSSVAYGDGSSSGTKVSSSKSFKAGTKVSVEASGGILGTESSAGVSFGVSRSTTSADELDIKKSVSTEISVRGPGVDGIDHDRDQIWLWLNPKLKVTIAGNDVRWTVPPGQTADIQFVFVGHLKNPSLMPPGVVQRLQANGITPADYPEILRANPMANNPLIVDGKRYLSLFTTFPYQPPFAKGDPVTTFSATLSSSATETTTQTLEKEYKVGMKLSAEGGFPGLAKLKLSSESEWTWSNKSSNQVSGGTAESAKVTVGGPSFGYTGPTDIMVFYDRLYKTFLFRPLTDPIRFQGVLTSTGGRPIAGRELALTFKGRTYRTVTNARGEYRFPVAVAGNVEFRTGTVTRRVNVPSNRRKFDLEVQ